MRVIVDHAYHRIDYEEVWTTLRDDVPRLGRSVQVWHQLGRGRNLDIGPDLDL